MASVNEDGTVLREETSRRTRSGRKASAPPPPTPVRSTRRSSRKQTQEHIHDTEETGILLEEEEEGDKFDQSDIIKEMLAEAAQGVISSDEAQQSISAPEDEEEEVMTINTDNAQQQLVEGDVVEEVQNIESEIVMQDADDEKSSSFPFGNVLQSENSDGIKNELEEVVQEVIDEHGVNSSLLASLAGDNANSLPSAGEESQSKENFELKADHDDTMSEPAIAEDLPNQYDSDATIINNFDAEMVSEDELPMPVKPKVNDAEEVSDDELPGPKRAELPADTEVVSEDELPSNKIKVDVVLDTEGISEDELPSGKIEIGIKRKLDDSCNKMNAKKHNSGDIKDTEAVSDEELPPKKPESVKYTEVVSDEELPTNHTNKDSESISKRRVEESKKSDEQYNPGSPTEESTDGHSEKRLKIETENKEEKKKEKKKLADLEKYWKTVKEDPADFTGWTYLLQYVDQETDVEAAREAYDAFLSHYPYCYGYWRKYADYEKRKGDKSKCDEVFERGLKAIPLSVDLWIHYLAHVKGNYSDNEDYIRTQFERALNACGLEFRSDKLWDAFIKWETDAKRYKHVIIIYDRLLAIPTQGYNGHFENFQDVIMNHPLGQTIPVEEFKKLRSDFREAAKSKEIDDKEEIANTTEDEPDDNVRSEEESIAIRDKFISSRRKIHKQTVAAVSSRWTFEEGIKRPYFHVKPLERCQLKNWKEYLDFEIEKGDRKRILILFERCLIACALYDEFWLKLIRYLESQPEIELIPITRNAFERACTIHHPDKPNIHLMWSAFEEFHNNFDKAAEILEHVETNCPNLLQISYRRINLERRRRNFPKCKELYEHYISTAKNKNVSGSLAIKYARFCHKILKDVDEGVKILKHTLEGDSGNTRVALHLIDMTLQREDVDEVEVVAIMDKFTSRESMDPDQKVLFAQRKVEFLEDFGSTAKCLQDAQRALQIALAKANESKKKSETSPNKKQSKDTNSSSGTQSAQSAYNSNYNYGATNSAASGYYNSGQQQSYQQQYDGYGYNHWQYGSNYSNYGQWGGYANYY